MNAIRIESRIQRRAVLRVTVAVHIMLLAGCSKEIDVKGEVFSTFRTNVVPRAGTQLFFLTEKENKAFSALVEERRRQQRTETFNAYRALTNEIGVAISFEEVTTLPDFDSDGLLA